MILGNVFEPVQLNASIVKVSNSENLRVTGSNLNSGCKAKFEINGKTKNLKIYMTNTGRSVSFYVKLHGKNKPLFNDNCYQCNTYNLENTKGWYLETY